MSLYSSIAAKKTLSASPFRLILLPATSTVFAALAIKSLLEVLDVLTLNKTLDGGLDAPSCAARGDWAPQ